MVNEIKVFLGLKRQKTEKPFLIGYEGSWKKKEVSLSHKDLLKHVLIVGAGGLGQQRRFLCPTINSIKDSNSFIVVDNGDIYQARKQKGEYKGKQEVLFDYSNPESDKFNWIAYCKDEERWAFEIAKASLFDRESQSTGFHYDMEAGFLAAIYAYTATLDNPIPATAYSLISNNSSTELIEILSKSNNKIVSVFVSLALRINKKVIANYLSRIKDSLSWLEDERIVSFTSTTNFVDFSRLRRDPVGVHLVIPDDEMILCGASDSLARIILTCALIQLMEENKGRSVYIFMRNLTDIGYFSYVDGFSYLSKNNIGIIACCESRVDDWLHYYEETTTKNILDSFHTKIFLEDMAYYLFAKYLSSNEQTISNQNLMNRKRNQGEGESFSVVERFKDYLVLIKGQPPFQVLKPM